MPIPTEPIGSIPRPPELIAAMGDFAAGRMSRDELQLLYDRALRDTIQRFEATGSPVITDGEQTKPSFATYPIHGLETLGPRSEEHTSELQSQSNLVCRLLLEKKRVCTLAARCARARSQW